MKTKFIEIKDVKTGKIIKHSMKVNADNELVVGQAIKKANFKRAGIATVASIGSEVISAVSAPTKWRRAFGHQSATTAGILGGISGATATAPLAIAGIAKKSFGLTSTGIGLSLGTAAGSAFGAAISSGLFPFNLKREEKGMAPISPTRAFGAAGGAMGATIGIGAAIGKSVTKSWVGGLAGGVGGLLGGYFIGGAMAVGKMAQTASTYIQQSTERQMVQDNRISGFHNATRRDPSSVTGLGLALNKARHKRVL